MTRDNTSFWFDPDSQPVVTVKSGEELIVETQDAHSGTITGGDVVYSTFDDVMDRIGGANPVTGPIAIEDVEPGDLVSIEIGHVEGAPVTGFGYMNTTPTLHPDFVPATTICHRRGDEVEIPTDRGPVMVPYRPFIGTLGLAPEKERMLSFSQSAEVMGNVDLPDLAAGARVVIRANVAGGLLSLGDAHLAQGDAEIHRSAIETQADVTLRARNLGPDGTVYGDLPQLNTDRTIGSVAPGPGHLEDLVRSAYDDLALRLHRGHGYSLPDAYRLLGAVGTVRIGQVVPPVFSALARIDREYLEGDSES